ncbi:MAG: hypothetical protein IMZ67_01060 [Acidobacteria bacterium]|nr:hypothetical protein [Acidobacteriota bacterium]
MTRERWVIVGVAVVAVAAALLYFTGRTTERAQIDLIQRFDTAEKRPADPPPAAWCVLTEASLNGVTRRAIKVLPESRLIFKVTVPQDASLRVWIGLEPDVWDKEGDGVLFRIGVSDGRTYEELLNQHVNPFVVRGDRQWVPVSIDLSAYGGRQVDVILNTNSSLPNRPADARNDKPLWGEPAIYAQ